MHYTITQADVGKPFLRLFGRIRVTSDWIGCILPCDVGKRVFLTAGVDVLQVENNEQHDTRTMVDRRGAAIRRDLESLE